MLPRLSPLFGCLLAGTIMAQPGVWTPQDPLPSGARKYAASFSIGDFGYMVGGINSTDTLADVHRYTPTSDDWTELADFPGEGRYGAVAFSVGGKGYLCFGHTTEPLAEVWSYDPVMDSWEQKNDFPGGARDWAMTFTADGIAYVGLGYQGDPGQGPNDLWAYDPATDTWTEKAGYPGSGRASMLAFGAGGSGFVGGGTQGLSYYSDFYRYDPLADEWTARADHGGGEEFGAVCLSVGDGGFVTNGYNGRNELWYYHAPTDTWTQLADYPNSGQPWDLPTGAIGMVVQNRLYVGTGMDGNSGLYDHWAKYHPLCDPVELIEVNNSGPICGQGEVEMTAVVTGTAPVSYSWAGLLIQGDNTLPTISALQVTAGDQLYVVTATNACGTVQGSTTVTMTEPPFPVFNYQYPGESGWCTTGGEVNIQNTFNWVQGGVFSSPDGAVVDAQFGNVNAAATGAGSFMVLYDLPALGGCEAFQTSASIFLYDPGTWYPDQDGDGAGDPGLATTNCQQPFGTVGNGDDECPFDPAKTVPGSCGCGNPEPGTACDDGNTATENDVIGPDCNCAGGTCVPPSDLVITEDGPVCGQGAVSMGVTALGSEPFTYQWAGLLIQGDATLPEISALQVVAGDQVYTVTVTNACGTANGEITVSMTDPPMGQFNYDYLGIPTTWCTTGGEVSVQNAYNWVAGGTYFSPDGAVVDEATGAVNVGATPAGFYTVYYSLPASGGCDAYFTGAGIAIAAPQVWYNDQDGDGAGDPASATTSCEQPPFTVTNGDDQCPIDPAKTAPGSCGCGAPEPGTACDDNDPETDNDVINETCACAGGGGCVPPSDLIVTNDGPICGQGEVAMSVTSLGTEPITYQWTGQLIQGDETLPQISALQVVAGDQVYAVTVSNACGTVEGQTTVTMTDPPIASFDYNYLGMPTSWCTSQGPVAVQNLYNWVAGGTFSSTDGAVVDAETGTVDASASGTGNPSVTYDLPAQGGCPAYSTTAFISLFDPQVWYNDQDDDGAGDPATGSVACEQPLGTVNNADDQCPIDPLKVEPGVCGCGNPEPNTPCDDFNEMTINDLVGPDCICAGEGPQAVGEVAAPVDRVRYDRVNDMIYVHDDARTPVLLLDATGRQMARAFGPVARFNTVEMPPGVYIIRASGLSERVLVD